MNTTKKVYIVHAVDTEGPLYEPLRVNFERIEEEYGIQIEPTYSNLRKLQNKSINLNGKEDVVARMLSSERISYHETWDQIDSMLDIVTSDEFRNKLTDYNGNGWLYNWMCMDHVGIDGINPRRRDIGYHNIFDHYVSETTVYFSNRIENRLNTVALSLAIYY